MISTNIASDSSVVANGKVNINTATEQDLQTLPGIGAAKAADIVRYRSDNGRFSSVKDLKKISGLGEKTTAKFEG